MRFGSFASSLRGPRFLRQPAFWVATLALFIALTGHSLASAASSTNPSAAKLQALESQVTKLESLLAGVSRSGHTLVFSG